MRYPLDLPYHFTNTFNDPAGHGGLDLANGPGASGKPVLSAVTGTVISVGTNPSYIGGLYVIVREDSPNRWEYYTGHCRKTLVSVGQRVAEGQQIGEMGMTGTATGPHVHFQIRGYGAGALIDPVYVYNYYNPSGGGSTMFNDDTARQVAYHFLGRNGFDGAGNALGVGGAPDLVGRPLSNAEFQNIFLSAESRQWRDVKLPQVFGERNDLRALTANQTEQIARLKVNETTANAQRDAAVAEKNTAIVERDKALAENATLKAEKLVLEQALVDKVKRIAEVEAAGSGDVSINFNVWGNVFWSIIKAIGLKKKGES